MPTLEFKGKQHVYAHHLTVPYRPLVPDAGKSFYPAEADDNLIVHSDNLHTLKALLPRYAGKIKCIYIDPPYNTGNEGWIYNDNVNSPLMQQWLKDNSPVDGEDLERHDKWLCMMWPRLHLLRELLTDDGIIFVSIDDNEQHHLRMLMDEIFGEGNSMACLHVEMSATQGMKVASALRNEIVKNGEYILIYSKDKHQKKFANPLYIRKEWDTHYTIYYNAETGEKTSLFAHMKNRKEILGLSSNFKARDISTLYSGNKEIRNYLLENANYIYQDAMCDINFNLSGEDKSRLDAGDYLPYERYLLKKTSTGSIRQLLSLELAIGITDDFKPSYGMRKIRGDWWTDYYKDMMNINKEGDIEFKNGKKPTRLLRDIIKISTKPNDIILDSFAGSGTTAHAVLTLNKEDGGNRKFILVECEDYADTITAERVRRVINGVPGARDKALQEGLGGSLHLLHPGQSH